MSPARRPSALPVRMIRASRHRRAPPPDVAAAAAWTTPRDINGLEWFASANDICRVYASLATPRLPAGPGPRSARCFGSTTAAWLSTRPQWKTTWFKGGSEPGVLTLT
jgi:hypothetical protein